MDENKQRDPEVRNFLQVVFRHKKKVITIFLATLLTAALGTYLSPPTYEVSSKVLVKLGREYNTFPATAGTPFSPIVAEKEEVVNSEIEILKSRLLVERVVTRLGLDKLPQPKIFFGLFSRVGRDEKPSPFERAVIKIQKKLSIKAIKGSDVIEIKFQSDNPRTCTRVVNTLVNSYLEYHVEVHKSLGELIFFQQQAKLYQEKLKESGEALREFKQEHSIVSIKDQKANILKLIAHLNQVLASTTSSIYETEEKISKIKRKLNLLPHQSIKPKEIRENPTIQALEKGIVRLEIKRNELMQFYTPQSRKITDIEREVAKLKERLSQEVSSSVAGDLLNAEIDLSVLKSKRRYLKAQILSLTNEVKEIDGSEEGFNQLAQAVEVNKTAFLTYVGKVEEARISEAMDRAKIANIRVIEPALPPFKPIKPRKGLNLLLAAILGLVGGLGVVSLSNWLDHSFKTGEEVEYHLNLPLLASIPERKNKK